MAGGRMKSIVLYQPFQLEPRTDPIPTPGPGEALLRVERLGVCGTDWHAYAGEQPFFSYPRIVGHEIGAQIVAVGENERGLQPGDRVVVEPLLPCGQCYACRIGKYNCCAHLQVLGVQTDGAMREYLTLPVQRLYRSEKLNAEELALCETFSIAVQANRRGRVTAGELVCVLGAGPIGLAVMQVAKAYGATVVSLDLVEAPLALARELGADHVVHAGATDAAEAVRDLTGGEGAPVVIEAVGHPRTMEQTVDLVAHGGRVVIVGLTDRPVTFPASLLVRKELDLLGSRNSHDAFPEVLRLAESGQIRLRPMISHRVAFDDVPEFFAQHHAHRAGMTKAVILVTEGP